MRSSSKPRTTKERCSTVATALQPTGPNEWYSERMVRRISSGPAWRWHAVKRLLSGPAKLPATPTDPQIRRLASALRDASAGNPLTDEDRQLLDFAEIAEAIHEDQSHRLSIEARVLANQDVGEIAAAMAIPPKAAQHYEDFYFDIRDLLRAYLAIGKWVFDDPVYASDPVRLLVCRGAYYGGIVVAEYLLGSLNQIGECHDLSTEEGRRLERVELNLLAIALEQNQANLPPSRLMWALNSISPPPLVAPTIAAVLQRRVSDLAMRIWREESTTGQIAVAAKTPKNKRRRADAA